MIEINNLAAPRIKKNFLVKISKFVLAKERKKERNLSVALVGPERIKALNKKYRKKDRITDVLSFPEPKRAAWLKKGSILKNELGEIIICPAVIKENAKKFKSSFKKELARTLIHGILHLLGLDHEKGEKEAKKMRKREECYLKLIKF